MCIRDRYQRRVHGIQTFKMDISKGVIGKEVGILTHILLEVPNASKVVGWIEANGNATMYKVLNDDNKITYVIKQYHESRLQGGLEWKERALKEKIISDLLCQYSPYVGQVIDVRVEGRPVRVDGSVYDFVATEILLHYGGEELMQYRKQVKVDKNLLCDVICQSALAIATAHQQGIFHGDITPKNMLYNGSTFKTNQF
eukprot:TRINITY_DN5309_c0_g2_i12.p2 TRINITY_DN5309_c0_g2~~TRINITY_DN5309_c0_g2_i12.p2  ORF type:complete len:199 (-),score=26.77 TRINITY_DN5309_c0_g2_i12:209-805(-)